MRLQVDTSRLGTFAKLATTASQLSFLLTGASCQRVRRPMPTAHRLWRTFRHDPAAKEPICAQATSLGRIKLQGGYTVLLCCLVRTSLNQVSTSVCQHR